MMKCLANGPPFFAFFCPALFLPSLTFSLTRDVQSCLLLAIIAIFNLRDVEGFVDCKLKEFLTFDTYSLKLLE